ncbi:MAG: VOC family protein [Thermomicrobiales bacterium]
MTTIRVLEVVIDCPGPDPRPLRDFYQQLTGFTAEDFEPGYNPLLTSPAGCGLGFQPVEDYRPPTWPTQERGQQIHLEFVTEDIAAAVAYAESIGATRAPAPPEDDFTVMLDPAGHPFCIAAPFTGLEQYSRQREIVRDGVPNITLAGVNFDCPDLAQMIRFMIGMTGMEYVAPEGEYPKLLGENGLLYLFQEVEGCLPPTWPS